MTLYLIISNHPKHTYYGKLCFGIIMFWYTHLNPFQSKLFDISFNEQLKQTKRNLQSEGKTPCSCANYRRVSSECCNAGRETRVQSWWGGEGLVRHRERAAGGAPGGQRPRQDPRCLSAHSAIEERIIQNTNTALGQGKPVYWGSKRRRKGEGCGREKDEGSWCESVNGEEEEGSRGDGEKGSTTAL